jgi:benzoyl-CoA 2,3-dioxygenase component B
VTQDTPALSALNMRLRDDYVADCNAGVGRWNRIFEKYGVAFQIKLPSVAFHRHIGEFASIKADVDGNLLSDAEWEERKGEWVPDSDDRDYVESLMQPEYAAGKYAPWISPPKVGVDNKPGDFEYVKIHE